METNNLGKTELTGFDPKVSWCDLRGHMTTSLQVKQHYVWKDEEMECLLKVIKQGSCEIWSHKILQEFSFCSLHYLMETCKSQLYFVEILEILPLIV